MDDSLFDALCQSVREAGAIRRGDKQSSRETTASARDTKAARKLGTTGKRAGRHHGKNYELPSLDLRALYFSRNITQ
ncbi:hypothetical protein CLV83_1855 [Marinobacterium mangrovicola]|uniref:Uncharacterized protein n=1 Tax=Marinobacterium mangrovicola TaxID=1476959 RepID=A0A4R1GFJ7_9GAMM|nr:hypothetical protein CLV83_1855 [Marinobacterium mangrovicola]